MSATRHSVKVRHHPVGSPPPDLKAVLQSFQKACRKGPLNGGQRAARGLVASGCREIHNKRGAQDDYVRFLLNLGVLIPDPENRGRMYFDADRGEEVLAACEASRQPPSSSDSTHRLVQLRGQFEVMKRSSPPDQIPMSDATEVSAEALPIPAETVESTVETECVEPEPQSENRRRVEMDAPIYALSLTELEADIWTSFVSLSEMVGEERRVGVPKDSGALKRMWCPRSLEHVSVARYARVVERFLESGIFAEVGPTSDRRITYRFTIPPEAFEVFPITRRWTTRFAQEELKLVQDQLEVFFELRRRITHAEAREAFEVLQSQGLCPSQGYLFGIYPEDGKSRPVFRFVGALRESRRSDAEGLLISYPGFESCTFSSDMESDEHVAQIHIDRNPSAHAQFLIEPRPYGEGRSTIWRTRTPEYDSQHPCIGPDAFLDVDDGELTKLQEFYTLLKEGLIPEIHACLAGVECEMGRRDDVRLEAQRKREELERLGMMETELVRRQEELQREMQELQRQREALQK